MFERLDSRPDVLTEVLRTVQLSSVLSARATVRAPWALHFGPVDRRAGFHVIVDGSCVASLDESATETVPLGPGDVVVFPHGGGHRLMTAGWPSRQQLPEFADIVAGLPPGQPVPLEVGGSGEPATVLCGSYAFAAASTTPLLHGLPALIHLPAAVIAGTPLAATADLLGAEAGQSGSGTGVVIDRLVDLLFVYALRVWLASQTTAANCAWVGALHDDVIGPALRAVHADPGYPWTMAALASEAGLSRAAFARRFQAAVGEAPLTYVRRWRMTVASERLARGDRIATVAGLVGYENEFAFAKAFKRVRGVAPGHFRQAARRALDLPARPQPLSRSPSPPGPPWSRPTRAWPRPWSPSASRPAPPSAWPHSAPSPPPWRATRALRPRPPWPMVTAPSSTSPRPSCSARSWPPGPCCGRRSGDGLRTVQPHGVLNSQSWLDPSPRSRESSMSETATGRVWLITGASSGFGRAIAQAALAAGDTVVAGVRRLTAVDDLAAGYPGRVAAVELDVTNGTQVTAAVQQTLAAYGRVDVLFNNAGKGLVGAVEETADGVCNLMDLHFFGPAALIRAVLPPMRDRRSGAIVNLTSQGGRFSFPGVGGYSATKFALEGLSEALAPEVAPFGIKVLIAEPGAFRTGFAGGALEQAAAIDAYADITGPVRANLSPAAAASPGTRPRPPTRSCARSPRPTPRSGSPSAATRPTTSPPTSTAARPSSAPGSRSPAAPTTVQPDRQPTGPAA